MADELEVRHRSGKVGRLRLDEQGRFCFRYNDEWLASSQGFAISIGLPMAADEIVGAAAHGFFTNLLPEGLVRQRVAARLGVSEGNDFELLRALGGECAGALAVVPPDRPSAARRPPTY